MEEGIPMKSSVIVFSLLGIFGCSTPQRGYVDCNEQNVGVRSGELICTNVGFLVYRWQIYGNEIYVPEVLENGR